VTTPPTDLRRRAILRRGAQLAAAGAAWPMAMNLSAIADAAAADDAGDYKALVCVFLYGGNDHANTVVHYDQGRHAAYQRIRASGGIALARDRLAATELKPAQVLAGGFRYALHPSMGELAQLFNDGRAAVVLNVGPLVMPLSRAQYQSGLRSRYPVPPQLFSHNDQQSVWQSSGAEGSTVGWGGRFGDLVMAGNPQAIFTCISLTGNTVFLSGRDTLQYQCTPRGAVPAYPVTGINFGWPQRQRDAFLSLVTQPRTHWLENEYTRVTARAIDLYGRIDAALKPVTLRTVFPTTGGNDLGDQLQGVARLIAARQALGVRRQVFLVSINGFDLHDRLLENQPGLMSRVSRALSAFYVATLELGIADRVTTFTASDFGRTLSSNGNGSDHGWGGHHVVVGGAVRGGRFYGTPAEPSIDNTAAPEDQWHVGQGRLLPSTSVDQFAATLARWFGVGSADLADILPNLRQFGGSANGVSYPVDLGFV